MGKINNEVKTGIMVVVCLTALGILTFKVGDFKVFKKGYEIQTRFSYTTGIAANSVVRVCGVDVGQVKFIKLNIDDKGNASVILTLWLPDNIRIRRDSTVQINLLGLMGDKYVEIYPSSSNEPYLKNGDFVIGKDPFRTEEFIKMGEDLGKRLDSALLDLQNLTQQVNGVVSGNRKDIDQIVLNLKDTTANFKEFSEDLKKYPWKLLFKTKETEKTSAKDKK